MRRRKQWEAFYILPGIFLILLGASTTIGWYAHIPILINVLPSYVDMVMNTAICFITSGIALLFSRYLLAFQKSTYIVCGSFIFLISALTLLQYIFNYSIGIDQLFIKVWLFDQNIYPGRMAINTAITFLLAAIAFILFPFLQNKMVAFLVHILLFFIIFMGALAFFGYLLKLEFLYNWYTYTRMALHTATGFIILGLGLVLAYHQNKSKFVFYKGKEDKKILLLSFIILCSIALIAGLSGFAVVSNNALIKIPAFAILARQQFELILPILLILVLTGAFLLYWQVSPLLQQICDAKDDAMKSNHRLNTLFNHASEGIVIINAKSVIEMFNPQAAKMFGYSLDEVIGKPLDILIPYDMREQHKKGMQRYLSTQESSIINKHRVEVDGLKKNGNKFPMELAINEMLLGNERLFIGMMHDISTRKMAESKLLESENKFRLAFDYSPIGIALVSLKGQWLKVNKSLSDILGYSENELLKLDFQSITHPDDLEEDLNYAKQLYEGKINCYTMEKRYICKDKKITWILLTGSIVCDEQGKPLYCIALIQDINEKKKEEKKLSYHAYYDTLTGLVNRNQLEQSLEVSIAYALEHQQKFAIYFLDIDHFKRINDTLGHDAGDHLLKEIGDRLKKLIRSTDIAARLGGDEFILVLNGINNAETAASFAETIINALLYPIKIKDHELFITASIGICFYPNDGLDYQTLIKNADLALYQAKERGKNNYQFCTPEINKKTKEKITLKKHLEDALDSHEFYLDYQPKIDVITKEVMGAEVLLRWKNNYYSHISPSEIIPLAEELGLILPLSDWIIRTACNQAKKWRPLGMAAFIVSINIADRQFMQPNFVEKILEILQDIDFSGKLLELEISENLIMQDPCYSLKLIKALKQIGILITIDHFGTGYSSLSYLHQFSVDKIKIDKLLIAEITKNKNDHLLISAIINLAKSLNIKNIVEGIETKEQLDLLIELGCDEAQGHYISYPISADKMELFLKENNAAFH